MNHPLKDIHIVVTRDPAQSVNLTDKLTALGGKVYALPTIRISPPADWGFCDHAISRIDSFDWIIFTSSNGVRSFLERARKITPVFHLNVHVAAVGNKTAETLQEYGIEETLVPETYTAEGLLEVFSKMDISGLKILIPTSGRAADALPAGLRQQDASVEKIICYETAYTDNELPESLIEPLRKRKMDCFTFYSPSSFKSMLELLAKNQLRDILTGDTALAAIGPVTARVIRDHGYEVRIQPEKSQDESMIEAIVSYFSKKN